MDAGSVIAGSVLLVAMIAVAGYAAVTLPADAQVPVHYGIGGYNNWQPKRVAVALWAGVAVLLYVLILVTAAAAGAHGTLAAAVILPVAQLIVIANQLGAIRAARARTGS